MIEIIDKETVSIDGALTWTPKEVVAEIERLLNIEHAAKNFLGTCDKPRNEAQTDWDHELHKALASVSDTGEK